MANIIVGVIVAAVIGLAARSVYRTKKSGGCSCGCDGCEHSKNCH